MDPKELKKVREFFKFRVRNWDRLSNYPDDTLKKSHGRKGRNALKTIGKLLGLEQVKVDFNPSGIIDGGYLTLIGMKGEKGIYISLSCSNLGPDVLYRTAEHMKDYRGGTNNFLTSENFVEDPERCLAALARLLA